MRLFVFFFIFFTSHYSCQNFYRVYDLYFDKGDTLSLKENKSFYISNDREGHVISLYNSNKQKVSFYKGEQKASFLNKFLDSLNSLDATDEIFLVNATFKSIIISDVFIGHKGNYFDLNGERFNSLNEIFQSKYGSLKKFKENLLLNNDINYFLNCDLDYILNFLKNDYRVMSEYLPEKTDLVKSLFFKYLENNLNLTKYEKKLLEYKINYFYEQKTNFFSTILDNKDVNLALFEVLDENRFTKIFRLNYLENKKREIALKRIALEYEKSNNRNQISFKDYTKNLLERR